MDKILLRDLSIQGIIGISEKERSKTQEILVNAELYGDFSKAFISDSIDDCINYRTVAKKIQAYVKRIGRQTVEALSNDLIDLCLEEEGVKKAMVRVEKPGAVRNSKSVGAELVRERISSTKVHQAYILLGTNIDPEENIIEAIKLLDDRVKIHLVSRFWQSAPFNGSGPDFLNAVVWISTRLSESELNEQVLTPIENQLGRHRTADKNAPRTIDLDILIFDEEILHPSEFSKDYLLVPMNEVRPDLKIMGATESIESYLEKNPSAEVKLRSDLRFVTKSNKHF